MAIEKSGPGYFKMTVEIEAMDIRTMSELDLDSYRSYLDEMFWVDHHDVLRSQHGGFPVAATATQLDLLVQYLAAQRVRLKGE